MIKQYSPFLLGAFPRLFAQLSGENLEQNIKSAYIFKFGNYVTWPEKTFAEPSSPIIIGIVEDETIAAELEKIAADRKTGGRPVVIKRLFPQVFPSEVHILYVSNTAKNYLALYQNSLNHPSTLYITNTEEGFTLGSIINFVRDDDRIRFDVSLIAAENHKIKLDGSLLTVARHVIK